MRVTSSYFGHLTSAIAAVADECCDGRLVAVTEGGYDLTALAESLRETILALDGGLSRPSREAAKADPSPRGEATLKAVLPHLRDRWKL
jgi:acetoin utilization deacetylase AcuC-like enzyme